MLFRLQVQPQGNIDFKKHDRYWTSGDGCHTVLHYYSYPSNGMAKFWLADLMKIEGTSSFLDLYRLKNSELTKAIENSIEEKGTRITGNSKISAN